MPWGWADHGEAEAGVEEGRPCLVGQRGDLSLTWREEEGGSYRRLWVEEGGAYPTGYYGSSSVGGTRWGGACPIQLWLRSLL